MVTRHDIFLVDDNEMPAGKDWLMIHHADGLLCVIRRACADDPRVLTEAWAASRAYRPSPWKLLATG